MSLAYMIDYRRRQTKPHSGKTLIYHCRDPIDQLILLKFISNQDVLILQYSWNAPAASVAALLGMLWDNELSKNTSLLV